MNELLLKQKVTGETLRAYDQIIRDWVNDQLKKAGVSSGVTEDRVSEIVTEALSKFDGGLTEEEVRQIVTDTISTSDAIPKEIITVSDLEIQTIVSFREAIGGNESEILPSSIRFKNVKIYYTKDSAKSSIDFKDSIIWVTWEPATEAQGRTLKFFGEDFKTIVLSYARDEEGVTNDPNFSLSTLPLTVGQEINDLETRLDAVEAGFGSVDIPAWIGQVVLVDSANNCTNVGSVNSLIWPGQDFSDKTNHFVTVFLGRKSGIHMITRKPGGLVETAFTVVLQDQPIIVEVVYDDLGAWVYIRTIGARYCFRSLDSAQEYFEYDNTDSTYYVDYQTLPTSGYVQEMIDSATADALTETRVQEMIDASIGSAISDSY